MQNQPIGIPISQLMNLEIKFSDDENRPLAENKVPFEYKKDVSMQQSVCPYSDSRYMHHKPMNVSALKQITKYMSSVIGSFSFIRRFYLGDQNSVEQITRNTTLLDFYKIIITGYFAPSYLIYHSESLLVDCKIPASIAVIYKAAAGLVSTAQLMLFKGIITGAYDKDTIVDPEMVFSFTDAEGLFIGAQEVCAGPPNMIMDVLEAIINGKTNEPSSIEHFISDFKQFSYYVNQAGEVLFLDFFFPILFYFSLPVTHSTNIFNILEKQDFQEENNSPIISMELQLLQIISPLLDSFDEDFRENVLAKSLELLAAIDLKANLVDQIKAIYDLIKNEGKLKSDKLTEFVFDLSLSQFQIQEIEILTQGLVAYLLLEKKKLEIYSKIQLEMNKLLNRTNASRLPDIIDLNKMYGEKLRNQIERTLLINIEYTSEGTIIRKGLNKILI